jgi:hypothetical protein
MKNYQDRIFLILEDDSDEIKLVKDILKSPLGLAKDIIKCLFDDKFDDLRNSIDEIKGFAAGIQRADKLKSYSLASYYPYMFAFHQYFHSSYRARQGKVLEKVVQEILKNYGNCNKVPNKNDEMINIIRDIFGNNDIQKLDLDAMGISYERNKAILIQIRSRDDTGGTTAKGSLVDLLRELLRTNQIPAINILYLVCIWVPMDSQQKNSTVKKMFLSLKNLIDVEESDFAKIVHSSIELKKNINLRVAYGTDEIAQILYEWIGNKNNNILKSISEVVNTIIDWDDLWISYAIASMELSNFYSSGYSNIKLLNDKFGKLETKFEFNSYKELTDSVDQVLQLIMPLWTECSIPFNSLSDKIHYIRDLLFLKACYERIQ